jgi:hypothetical protein
VRRPGRTDHLGVRTGVDATIGFESVTVRKDERRDVTSADRSMCDAA